MSELVSLEAADGHELEAYVSRPDGRVRGGLVVVQEIFGVNDHIRAVADSYAKLGYMVLAPALFDRVERGIQLTYDEAGRTRAFSLYPKLEPVASLLDVAAAFRFLQGFTEKIGVLGFCYGGLIAWLAASRGAQNGMHPSCVVGYYPGGVGSYAGDAPDCPAMLHFGGIDSHIGPEQIEAIRHAQSAVRILVYAGAGHAFNRAPDPNSFHAASAALARERTEAFLKANLG